MYRICPACGLCSSGGAGQFLTMAVNQFDEMKLSCTESLQACVHLALQCPFDSNATSASISPKYLAK